MSPLPELAPQDLVVGLASVTLLLWTLMVVVRSGLFGDILSPTALDETDDGIFQDISPRRASRQLSFVGSIFLHLAFMSLLPWVEEFAPGKLPFRIRPYDFVVVQFKTVDTSLKIPSDLASVLPQPEPVDSPVPPDAELSDEDDPGVGNRIAAPNRPEPGGGADSDLIERVEIDFPERVAPAREALDTAEPAVELRPQLQQNVASQLAALAAPPEVPVPAPDIYAAENVLPEVIVGALEGQEDSGGSSVMDMEGVDRGRAGEALTSVENDAIRALLGESYGSGTLLDLIASARGAGVADGPGAGADVGPGTIGDFGDGFGEGWRGRGPVPRKLHGIIVISDEPAMPEAAGVLTGNPVYTVYIEVPGFDRKWILQVCEAGEEGGGLRVKDGVIRIVTRRKMDPPFAFRRVGPRVKADELDPYTSPPRVVVYGKVDIEGAISDLRIISGLDPETDDLILASMRDWGFHPAYRDGEAVAVEALFGIPLR